MFVLVGSCWWSANKRDDDYSFREGNTTTEFLEPSTVEIVGPVSIISCFFPDTLIHSRRH